MLERRVRDHHRPGQYILGLGDNRDRPALAYHPSLGPRLAYASCAGVNFTGRLIALTSRLEPCSRVTLRNVDK